MAVRRCRRLLLRIRHLGGIPWRPQRNQRGALEKAKSTWASREGLMANFEAELKRWWQGACQCLLRRQKEMATKKNNCVAPLARNHAVFANNQPRPTAMRPCEKATGNRTGGLAGRRSNWGMEAARWQRRGLSSVGNCALLFFVSARTRCKSRSLIGFSSGLPETQTEGYGATSRSRIPRCLNIYYRSPKLNWIAFGSVG